MHVFSPARRTMGLEEELGDLTGVNAGRKKRLAKMIIIDNFYVTF